MYKYSIFSLLAICFCCGANCKGDLLGDVIGAVGDAVEQECIEVDGDEFCFDFDFTNGDDSGGSEEE